MAGLFSLILFTTIVRFLGHALERLVVLFQIDELPRLEVPLNELSVLRVQVQLAAIIDRALAKTLSSISCHVDHSSE